MFLYTVIESWPHDTLYMHREYTITARLQLTTTLHDNI